MLRRDAVELPVGYVIAEFANGHDALDFLERCKDKSFTVTAGITYPFAVRKAMTLSQAEPLQTV